MGHAARIKALKDQIVETDKRTREAATSGQTAAAAYYGAHLAYYQARINEIKLDDLSERLELIETALGLMAAKKAG